MTLIQTITLVKPRLAARWLPICQAYGYARHLAVVLRSRRGNIYLRSESPMPSIGACREGGQDLDKYTSG